MSAWKDMEIQDTRKGVREPSLPARGRPLIFSPIIETAMGCCQQRQLTSIDSMKTGETPPTPRPAATATTIEQKAEAHVADKVGLRVWLGR